MHFQPTTLHTCPFSIPSQDTRWRYYIGNLGPSQKRGMRRQNTMKKCSVVLLGVGKKQPETTNTNGFRPQGWDRLDQAKATCCSFRSEPFNGALPEPIPVSICLDRSWRPLELHLQTFFSSQQNSRLQDAMLKASILQLWRGSSQSGKCRRERLTMAYMPLFLDLSLAFPFKRGSPYRGFVQTLALGKLLVLDPE